MEQWHSPAPEHAAFAGYEHGHDIVRMQRAGLVLHYYAPKVVDPQPPRDQDALYIVISGHGQFCNGPLRVRFGPGDVMVVPAGAQRRFETFTSDFACWMAFYGPKGGERRSAAAAPPALRRRRVLPPRPRPGSPEAGA